MGLIPFTILIIACVVPIFLFHRQIGGWVSHSWVKASFAILGGGGIAWMGYCTIQDLAADHEIDTMLELAVPAHPLDFNSPTADDAGAASLFRPFVQANLILAEETPTGLVPVKIVDLSMPPGVDTVSSSTHLDNMEVFIRLSKDNLAIFERGTEKWEVSGLRVVFENRYPGGMGSCGMPVRLRGTQELASLAAFDTTHPLHLPSLLPSQSRSFQAFLAVALGSTNETVKVSAKSCLEWDADHGRPHVTTRTHNGENSPGFVGLCNALGSTLLVMVAASYLVGCGFRLRWLAGTTCLALLLLAATFSEKIYLEQARDRALEHAHSAEAFRRAGIRTFFHRGFASSVLAQLRNS